MRIWILCTGEPVPFLPEEAGKRFLRAGKLAQYLHQQGHEVTWWTTRFDHYGKSFREVPANQPVRPSPDGPSIVFLESCGYKRHIGPRRFFDHWQVGRAFRRLAPLQEKPDVILTSFPLVELCHETVQYGRKHNVPTILDIRDLWPDVIYERLHDKLGISLNGFLLPYERLCKSAFRQADHVIGITKGMKDWCYARFGRSEERRIVDGVFRQFKPRPTQVEISDQATLQYWLDKGVDLNAPVLRCVWSGSLIIDSDGPTLLRAIEQLPEGIEDRLQIIIAGDGSLVPEIQAIALKHPVLKYVGWIESAELNALLEHSHIGLLCYLDRFDFQVATPNKVIDYCAAGMRILTNLTGEVASLSEDKDYIVQYKTADVASLSEVLIRLSDERVKFSTKSEAARAIFDAEFDAEHALPAFEAFLIKTSEQAL